MDEECESLCPDEDEYLQRPLLLEKPQESWGREATKTLGKRFHILNQTSFFSSF